MSRVQSFGFISGVLTEKRSIEGGKAKKVFMVALKVATFGQTIECSTRDLGFADSLAEGSEVHLLVRFGMRGFDVKLEVEREINPALFDFEAIFGGKKVDKPASSVRPVAGGVKAAVAGA